MYERSLHKLQQYHYLIIWMVNVELYQQGGLHSYEIAPIFSKKVLDLIVYIKLNFFLIIFLSLSNLFPGWI